MNDLIDFVTDKDVKCVAVFADLIVTLSTKDSNGVENTTDLDEGTDLYNVTIMKDHKEITDNYHICGFEYVANETMEDFTVKNVILKSDHVMTVRLGDIKSAGTASIVVSSSDDIATILSDETVEGLSLKLVLLQHQLH